MIFYKNMEVVYFASSPFIQGKKLPCVYVTDSYKGADETVKVTNNPHKSKLWWFKTANALTADKWVSIYAD